MTANELEKIITTQEPELAKLLKEIEGFKLKTITVSRFKYEYAIEVIFKEWYNKNSKENIYETIVRGARRSGWAETIEDNETDWIETCATLVSTVYQWALLDKWLDIVKGYNWGTDTILAVTSIQNISVRNQIIRLIFERSSDKARINIVICTGDEPDMIIKYNLKSLTDAIAVDQIEVWVENYMGDRVESYIEDFNSLKLKNFTEKYNVQKLLDKYGKKSK